MKYFVPLVLLVLVSFTSAQEKESAKDKGKTATHSAPASGFKSQMQKMADDWRAAFQAKDADKVAAMYTDDAVWINAEGIFHGSNDIKGELKKMMDRGDTVTSIVTAKTVHSDQIAYAEGTYSGNAPGKDGKEAPGSGSWVVSLKNDGGTWKLVTHTSVPGAATGSTSKAAMKP